MHTHEAINGKDVFIVQDHHHALAPWSRVRSMHEKAPILISLDHHTDSKPAYLIHMSHVHGEDKVNNEALREQFLTSYITIVKNPGKPIKSRDIFCFAFVVPNEIYYLIFRFYFVFFW